MNRSVRRHTVMTALLFAPPAWAAGEFPRGPGFYFNFLTFGLVLASYLLWVYLTAWVDGDARKLGLSRPRWSGLLLGGGLLGLLLFWMIPPFLVSFPLLLAAILGPYIYYVVVRNPLVPRSKRLWTEQHFKRILGRWLRLRLEIEPDEPMPAAAPEIKYLRKPNEPEDEEPNRIRKARQHRGAAEAAAILVDAIERRASELHLEPTPRDWNVLLQIDGVDHSGGTFPRAAGEQLIQAVKLLAELDLGEKRKPQEGWFSVEVDGDRYDCRVHTAGSVAGEKLGLRIAPRAQRFRLLPELGLSEERERLLAEALRQERGLLLVSGPPASGITSTAHSLLMSCDRFQKSIITIEDPVEVRLPNIDQFSLDRRSGENFAAALRNVLIRHEPHIIFVGALRDPETAELVCQKAAESHLLITTVNAPDAVTGLFRLVELGIPAAKLSRAVLGVLSPRLLRALCPDCKVKYRPHPDMVRKANLPVDRVKYLCRPPEASELPCDEEGQPMVCEKCRGIGYYGRTGIFEYLHVSERIRQVLRDNPSIHAVKQEAVRSGMTFLQDEAMNLAVEGITSIPEILRVLG